MTPVVLLLALVVASPALLHAASGQLPIEQALVQFLLAVVLVAAGRALLRSLTHSRQTTSQASSTRQPSTGQPASTTRRSSAAGQPKMASPGPADSDSPDPTPPASRRR